MEDPTIRAHHSVDTDFERTLDQTTCRLSALEEHQPADQVIEFDAVLVWLAVLPQAYRGHLPRKPGPERLTLLIGEPAPVDHVNQVDKLG